MNGAGGDADDGRLAAGAAGGPPALLVVGEVVTDVVARHAGPLARGTDTAARIHVLPGGAGANVACWAARWGLTDVRLLGRVGHDEAGWHSERLRACGVRPLLITDESARTATVVVLVDATSERTFLSDGAAASRLSSRDWSPSLLDGVAHLHLSGYLFFSGAGRRLAALALRSAASRAVPVSVDPASTGFIAALGAERLLAAYDGVEWVIPNAEEACCLTGRADPAEAARALSRRVPLAVVTLGADGALVAESGALTARVPAPAARPVDSTGAGDAFTGAFTAAWLSGADAPTAAEEGCRAGAEAVALVGGRPPCPGPSGRPGPSSPSRRPARRPPL